MSMYYQYYLEYLFKYSKQDLDSAELSISISYDVVERVKEEYGTKLDLVDVMNQVDVWLKESELNE